MAFQNVSGMLPCEFYTIYYTCIFDSSLILLPWLVRMYVHALL